MNSIHFLRLIVIIIVSIIVYYFYKHYNDKLKTVLDKINNKAFIEKAPDNVIENFKVQEQEIKSSIEKINEIMNTIT